MKIESKSEIKELFSVSNEEFYDTVGKEAKQISVDNGNILHVSAMLGYTNHCKNSCLYCGMSTHCRPVRYRISVEDIVRSAKKAAAFGIGRLFLVAGEDPGYAFEDLLKAVEECKKLGFFISLACGEFEKEQYTELKSAGADEYVVKFEMSNPQTFNRLNPSTNFNRRMKAIENIRECGMKLASGNIVDYPGQTLDDLADDILLMKKLNISWAPIIPYMPVKGTPLAMEGGRGSCEKNLREIAILRNMMPDIRITAQQPGENLLNGLADDKGNLDALNYGGDILFADLLPEAKAKEFSVVDNRNLSGLEHIRKMSELSGMKLDLR